MVPALLSGLSIAPAICLREDPLPTPIGRRIHIFSCNCIWQLNPASAVAQVPTVNGLYPTKVLLERIL